MTRPKVTWAWAAVEPVTVTATSGCAKSGYCRLARLTGATSKRAAAGGRTCRCPRGLITAIEAMAATATSLCP